MELADTMLTGEIQVFLNYIYEYDKGVRNMVLCTINKNYLPAAVNRLERKGICYFKQDAGERTVNLYFGKEECIEVVKQLAVRPLRLLSPEEDFILGALLGYDIRQQCERFCARKKRVEMCVG